MPSMLCPIGREISENRASLSVAACRLRDFCEGQAMCNLSLFAVTFIPLRTRRLMPRSGYS